MIGIDNKDLRLFSKKVYATLLLLGVWASEASAAPMFTGIGFLPGGTRDQSAATAVSRDGTVVAGQSRAAGIRWTMTGGIELLPETAIAWDISGDGQVVVGAGRGTNFPALGGGFRWTEATGAEYLGLIDENTDPSGGSLAHGTSGDGSVVVGQSSTPVPNTGGAFRWTEAGGMINLGTLSGHSTSIAQNVSADGSVVVGQSEGGGELEAYRWTEAMGMVGLGMPPGENHFSVAYAISDNGRFTVGTGGPRGGGAQAILWNEAGGMTLLGDLPGGIVNSNAYGVTDDGSIVVGLGRTDAGNEAAIWDATNGIRRLQMVLETDFGLNLSGWTLTDALDITFDGTTIVGAGFNPDGEIEGWIVTGLPATVITEPSPIVLLALALACISTLHSRRSSIVME